MLLSPIVDKNLKNHQQNKENNIEQKDKND